MYRVIECYWVIKLLLLMNGKGNFIRLRNRATELLI